MLAYCNLAKNKFIIKTMIKIIYNYTKPCKLQLKGKGWDIYNKNFKAGSKYS